MADAGDRLRSLLMLGMWAGERAELDRAIAKANETVRAGRIQHRLWAQRFGESLAKEVPVIIQEAGIRPAEAVAELIRTAVLYGIEIGQHLERKEAE